VSWEWHVSMTDCHRIDPNTAPPAVVNIPAVGGRLLNDEAHRVCSVEDVVHLLTDHRALGRWCATRTGATCTGATRTGSTCTGATRTGATCTGAACTGAACTGATRTGSTCTGA